MVAAMEASHESRKGGMSPRSPEAESSEGANRGLE